jgi:flavin reductase (DIM6/NTAB) family NADH-FMN oxidoreductase RutF
MCLDCTAFASRPLSRFVIEHFKWLLLRHIALHPGNDHHRQGAKGEHPPEPARERAMPRYTKTDFPVSNVRRFLEPGPIVLVSSAHKGETNIMTTGWHMIMEFEPSLIACYIWTENHSFEMIRSSRQCVINIPTEDLAGKVVKIGNSSGRDIDKFSEFCLTAMPGEHVRAPLIDECYASFECKLADSSLIRKYSLFVFEVVKAHVATSPKYPKTIHYRGDGEFMISGANTRRYRKLFKPEMR